jgi:hypothetical protein
VKEKKWKESFCGKWRFLRSSLLQLVSVEEGVLARFFCR